MQIAGNRRPQSSFSAFTEILEVKRHSVLCFHINSCAIGSYLMNFVLLPVTSIFHTKS
jgi:hypothetical protein